MTAPALIPELAVSDLETSLAFYAPLLGFSVVYTRPEEGFACIEKGSARLMLDQLGLGRDWLTGTLAAPYGRGINLQIAVNDLEAMSARLSAADVALFQPLETRSYRTGQAITRQRQFCVQDPDGYLLRFCQAVA